MGVDACAVCGGSTEVRSHADSRFLECLECGYGRIIASGRGDYWNAEHGSLQDHDYWAGAKEKYFDSALSLVEAMTIGRRLLDLGGGLGIFTERALARGWDAYTLDTSPTAAQRAGERVGTSRSLTEVSDALRGTFDAVTIWCVVAHLPDPAVVVRAAHSALREDGVIWLTTPNFAFQKPYAAVRKRLGKTLDFEADDHIGHFTSDALVALLSACGFTDVRFHFRGVTETCVAAGSSSRVLVEAKRSWNRAASSLLRFDVAAVSELQATARRRATDGP